MMNRLFHLFSICIVLAQLPNLVQTTRRLQDGGGPCQNDAGCNRNGKCQGIVNGQGTCRCKDGWEGLQCNEERCGDVTSCGKHGKCRHDECDCDTGYKGDDCDDEIDYEVKLVVAQIDAKTRRNGGCTDDLEDFFDELDDEDNDDKLDYPTLTIVPVPTTCGDGKSLHERFFTDDRRRHLKGKSNDDDEKAVLVGVVFVNSSTRSVSNAKCLENLKAEAERLQDKLKPKQLEDLDGKVVYYEATDACDTKRLG